MNENSRIKELELQLETKDRELNILKQENEALKEAVHQFEGVIYSSTSLITFLKGPDYIIEFANEAIKNVWGKGSQVEGKSLFSVLPEIRDQGIQEYLDQVFYKGEPFHAIGLPVKHEIDGKLVKSYFDFSYMPQYDLNGNIMGVGVVAQDTTQRELLTQKLKKSEAEFRELVNFMPHKINLSDAEGNILFCNQEWLDYLGKSLEEFKEEPWTDIIHPDEKENVENVVESCLATGKDLDLEIRIKNKFDKYIWHICRATKILDENGKGTSWISSCTEIQKIKEEEQQKEDFLKLVSHELKTPVTSIKGYVQLLLSMLPDENSDPGKKLPVKLYIQRIANQVESLIRLISEMLDLSRIEQKELKFKRETFQINNLVTNIVEDITFSNKQAQIQIDHKFDCEVNADRGRIGQVLINFVTNALKYSPDSNQVNIKIYQLNENEVAVSTKDYGIGIAKEEQKKIFNRFYRVTGNKDDTYAGFGIGLFLSSNIIERHHGSIMINSQVGKGSEFIFTLPIKK